MSNDRLLTEAWLEALAVGTAADGTIETYQDDLDCYLGWLSSAGLRLSGVTFAGLVGYFGHLSAKGYAEATVAHRRAVVRTLHAWLFAEGHAEGNPAALLEPMRRSRNVPSVLSIEETERFFDTAHSLTADRSLGLYRRAAYARRAALFEALYSSGMRITEAVRLPASVLANNGKMFNIRGKGDKERMVPLGSRAVDAMRLCRYRINTPHKCRLNLPQFSVAAGLPGRAPEDRRHVITDTALDGREGNGGDQTRGDSHDLGHAPAGPVGVSDSQADRRRSKDNPQIHRAWP
ncbi:site-specific integrase [Mesorhizobium sp. M2A.F.Ca.ET.039.01.1.1]|uniref:site-specific integrase n=1 Tax=Mesorhizobium sp. M2A.F.Ca.ET.039.01.1.1 TaxID=2496746 RepID=UPI00167AE2F4|nr:site-specific integrase [Mesorhizobium sp. M2A.F.Ca.ET.039.01.1.1]